MKNVLKIVFLGIAGFALLVFLTAEKPKQLMANDEIKSDISLASLPATYQLVGKDKKVSKEDLFKNEALIIVGNHDSLSVVKELPNYFEVKTPYVMVANISAAPWFVKKLFIPGKLEELNQNTNIPMVYDFDGDTVNALKVTDNAKTVFVAFKLYKNGAIKRLYKGNVKEGALDGSMSEEEKKEALKPLSKLL